MKTTTLIKKIIFNFLMIFLSLFFNTTISSQTQIHDDHDNCKKPFELLQSNCKVEINSETNFEISNPHDLLVSWIILGNNNFQKSGIGNQTGKIRFEKPGKYELIYSSTSKDKFLAHSEKIIIEVLPTSFIFDVKNVKCSNSISKGNPVDGITLTIPIEIKSYNNEKVKFGPFKNSSTGIDGIDVVLDNELELSAGLNQVVFKLHGSPQDAGLAQLGFFNTIGEGFFYNFIINK
jgi:hypothetical protein